MRSAARSLALPLRFVLEAPSVVYAEEGDVKSILNAYNSAVSRVHRSFSNAPAPVLTFSMG